MKGPRYPRRKPYSSRGLSRGKADFSEFEKRLIVALGFNPKFDLYKQKAMQIWGCEYDQVTEEQRRIAKARFHGESYV